MPIGNFTNAPTIISATKIAIRTSLSVPIYEVPLLLPFVKESLQLLHNILILLKSRTDLLCSSSHLIDRKLAVILANLIHLIRLAVQEIKNGFL